MSKQFKRLFAILLVLAMVISVLPAAFASGIAQSGQANLDTPLLANADEILENDVFARIEAVKANAAVKMGSANKMTEEDYINIVPQVIEAIKTSATYVPGSLQQNGYFLKWDTTTGMPCCYSPRMEAELNHDGTRLGDEQMAAIAEEENRMNDAVINGGSPSSNKIGLIQPYWGSASYYDDSKFLGYSPNYKTMWEDLYTATGGTGMRYSMYNATIDNIARVMEECGLVIFDSHGTTDYEGPNKDYTSRANCSYLCLITNEGVTEADLVEKTGKFGTYTEVMRGSTYAYVSGKAIANHMTKRAPHSLLYMGICLGMATDGMCRGLRDNGVETIWGYSQTVSFAGEEIYMKSILGYVKDGDEFKDAVKKTKDAEGWWDPAYKSYTETKAKANKIAFPICVSSEDVYPGHGNVDKKQNVYSTWHLYGNNGYTVTATSNNTSYGTVSVNRNVITATPKAGYYAQSYTVVSGSATVAQDGNTFTVTANSNCTIRINFAAKAKVTITFKANGATYTTMTPYSGDTFTLPTTATNVSGYTFIGWSTNSFAETTSKPSFYGPGTNASSTSNVTLYAVYSRVSGAGNDYTLVSSAPANWAGNYVITYGTNSSSMYVMKGLSGDTSYEKSSSGGAVALSGTGMTYASNKLTSVTTPYIFEVDIDGSYYTIKNASTNTYLANYNSYLYSRSSYESANCRWTLSYSNQSVTMKNASSNSYPYVTFYSLNKYFAVNTTAGTGLSFWKQAGTTYYTTSPSGNSGSNPTPTPTTNYTVNFTVPNGVSAVASKTVASGSTITLPTAGAPAGYTFLGWVTSTVSNTTVRPSVLTGSYKVTGNITLRALYSYTSTTSTGSGDYMLLGSAPANWAGNYIITFGTNTNSLYVLKGLSGNTSYENSSSGGAVLLSQTGMTFAGTGASDARLTNVNNAYVFNIAADGAYYTIKNASTNTYLASVSAYLNSRSSYSSSYCRWTLSCSNGNMTVKNAASSSYCYLSCYSGSKYFALEKSAPTGLYFWKQASGSSSSTTYYTTG